MSEYVIMPKSDYVDACDAIRAKTEITDTITSGQLKELIESISGSSEDVRYVTFMSYDGTIEYGKKAVAVGDDCADPIARGVFGTPTKESDVQYNYVHAGWATEVNGALDSNALKEVNEDRTVYANFAGVLRSYTIEFCDEDGTVLYSNQWTYGTVPSYTPTKDGYDFVAWEPSIVAVTGEADYTATWKAKAAFATATWADIGEILAAGNGANTFSVGDRKEITHTYANGTTENVEIEILHVTASGIYVGLVGVLTGYGNISWKVYGNSEASTADIYDQTMLKKHMDDILSTLPEDMQPLITNSSRQVYVASSKSYSYSNYKLWPFSVSELNAITGREGSPFEPYSADSTKRKKGYAYWTRSLTNNTSIYYINAAGNAVATSSSSDKAYISYFCRIAKPS